MRKDILLSLLAVGAVPTGAYADVNLNDLLKDGLKWQIGGLQGTNLEGVDLTSASGVYVGNASTGSLSTTLKDMPAGDYELTFGYNDNTKVTVDGKEPAKSGNTYKFPLSATKDIVIAISAKDQAKNYKVGNMSFVIKLGANTQLYKDALAEQGKGIAIVELTEHHEDNIQGNIAHNHGTLAAEVKRLIDEKKVLDRVVADLEDGDMPLEDYKIAKDNLVARITKFNADVKASNTAVNKANTEDTNYVANRDTRDGHLTDADGLKALVDAAELLAKNEDKKVSATETWIQTQSAAAIAAFRTELASFLALVNNTFGDKVVNNSGVKTKDNAKITVVSDEDKAAVVTAYDKLVLKKTAAVDKVNDAIEDVKQWNILKGTGDGSIKKLANKYNEAYAYIQSLTGKYATDRLTALDNLYVPANKQLAGTTKELANEKNQDGYKTGWVGNGKLWQQTYDAIVTLLGDVKANVAACDALYGDNGTWTTQLNGYKTDYTNKGTQVTAAGEANKAKLQAAMTEYNNAINALADDIDTEKKAYNANPDFDALVAAADAAKATVESELAAANTAKAEWNANNTQLQNWLTQLEAAKTAIKNISPVIADKLNGSYNNIKSTINAQIIKNNNARAAGTTYTLEDTANITSGIDTYKTDGTALANAYKTVDQAHNDLLAANTGLLETLKLTVLEGNPYINNKMVKPSADTFTPEINRIKSELDAALKLENDALYNAINAIVYDNITVADIDAARMEYADGVTRGNLAVMENEIGARSDEYTDDIEAATLTYGPGLKQLKNRVITYTNEKTALGTEIDNAVNATEVITPAKGTPGTAGYVAEVRGVTTRSKANAYKAANDKVCSKYNTMVADFNTFEAECKSNVAAHIELIKVSESAANKVAEVQKNIDDAQLDNDVNVIVTIDGKEVATTISGVKDYLEDCLDTIKEINSDEYEAYNSDKSVPADYQKANANGQKADLLKRYNKIIDEVSAVWNAISGGNYWEAVQKYNDNIVKNMWTNDLFKQLNDAYKYAVDTYNLYYNANKNEYYHAYITEALKDHQEIYNYATPIRDLQAEVEKAVKEALYDAQGNKLANPHAFAWKADFQLITSIALTYISDMTAYVEGGDIHEYDAKAKKFEETPYNFEGIVAFANAKAADYYETALLLADGGIADAEQDMTDAGINEVFIKEVLTAPKASVQNGKNAKANWERHKIAGTDPAQYENVLSLNMDNVLSFLEGDAVKVDTEKAASEHWDIEYHNSMILVQETYAVIEAAADVISHLEWEVAVGDQVSVITAATFVERAEELINEIIALDEEEKDAWMSRGILLNKVKGMIQTMNDNIDELNEIAEQLETARDNYLANVAAKGVYLEKLEKMQSAYDAMREAIGALDLTLEEFGAINTDNIDQYLRVLEGEINTNMTDAADNSDKYDSDFQALQEAIDQAYKDAYNYEKAHLAERLHDVEIDFNNAKADGQVGEDQLTDWNERIDAIRNGLAKMAPNNTTSYNTALKTMDKWETALDEIQTEITGKVTGTNAAKAAILAKLAEKAGLVTDEIALRQGELDKSTLGADILLEAVVVDIKENDVRVGERSVVLNQYKKDSYQAAIDLFTTDLELLQADVDFEGNMIVLYEDKYLAKYAAKLAAVQDYKNTLANADTAAEKEKARREASNRQAEALTAEVQQMKDDCEAVIALLSTYKHIELEVYEANIFILNEWIDYSENEIAARKARFNLDETLYGEVDGETVITHQGTELTYAEDFADLIKAMYETATLEETTNIKKAVVSGLNEIYNLIKKNNFNFINTEEISNEYDRIYGEWNALVPTSDVEKAGTVIGNAYDLLDDLDALLALVEESVFIPGNVNGSEDGEVTTSDFVALVDIVLKKADAPDADTKEFAAADLNGDGEIGIGDAVLLMKIINGKVNQYDEYQAAPARKAYGTYADVQNSVEVANGQINLTNNIGVVSMLFDLKNVSANEISLAERAKGMTMMTNTLEDGTVRVMIISTDNTALSGNEGAVLNVNPAAVIEMAVIADADGHEYVLVARNADAIDTITGAIKNMGQKIYNAGGQLMNGIKKGLNIIMNADGTSNKVVNK